MFWPLISMSWDVITCMFLVCDSPNYRIPFGVPNISLSGSWCHQHNIFGTRPHRNKFPYPYSEPVYTGWSSVHWKATGMPLVDPVYTGIPLGHPANTCRVHWNTTGKTLLKQPHTGMPLEKLSWIRPTLGCLWRNSYLCGLHWNTTGGTVPAHIPPDTYS